MSEKYIIGLIILGGSAFMGVFIWGMITIGQKEKEAIEAAGQRNLNNWQQQSNACIEAGGVPIKSGWTKELKECQFP